MSDALHEGTSGKGAVKYISASAAPQMCPMAQSRQKLLRRLPRRSHIAFLPKEMRGAHPSGEYCAACRRNIFPHPQLRCVIIFYKRNAPFRATSRQKQLRAEACVPPGGSAATARRAGACVSATSVRYVRTPRQAASQHRMDTKHRPHSAELPKPEYTPPPRSDVNQSYRLSASPAHGRV